MGAGQSVELPYKGSVIIEKGSGDNGDVRGNPRYKDLVDTVFPEVKTLYDAFQYVLIA